jgi:hypothetical protein
VQQLHGAHIHPQYPQVNLHGGQGCAGKRGGERIMVMQNRFEREDDWAGIVPSYTHEEYVAYNREMAELQKKVDASNAWMEALPQPPCKIAYLTRTVNSVLVEANQSIIDWKRHDPRFVVMPQYQETRRGKPCPAWHIPFDKAEETLPGLYSALEALMPSPPLPSGKPRPVKRIR